MRRSCQAIAIASLVLLPLAAQAAGGDFTLTNRTGQQIDRISVSQSNDRQWSGDAANPPQVQDGGRVSINLPTGTRQCQFDLEVEYHGGRTASWSGLNLCATPRVSLYWDTKTRTTSAQPG
jgi:hypothetical protein